MTPRRGGWLLPVVGGLLTLCVARPSLAVDGPRPRVPPLFPRASCVTVLDRSEEAFIEMSVPYEDAAGDVELPDARTIQLFAVCEEPAYGEELPAWVSWDDVARAQEAGLLEADPGAPEVLETSEVWPLGECVMPVSERLPTTCAGIDGGVTWDLGDVPVGNYVVYGYVFAPPMNVWARRPGIVRVTDGEDEPGPAVSVMSAWSRAEVYRDAGMLVSGCAAGNESTRVTLQWASLQDDAMAWTTFAEVDGTGSFEVSLQPPESTEYQALIVRAVAEDEQQRRAVGYSRAEIVVLPGCGASDAAQPRVTSDACELAEEPTPPAGEPDCEAEGPTPGTPGTDGTDRTPDMPGADGRSGSGSGCALGARDASRHWMMWSILLALGSQGPRRRRDEAEPRRGDR